MPIHITSSAFEQGQPIPKRHVRDGGNLSPTIQWSGLPTGTVELALAIEDPDAPRPEPFIHWVIYRIPVSAGELPEGVAKQPRPAAPAGAVQGVNSWGLVGYDGPQPPVGHGVHRYFFRLYALDKALEAEPKMDLKALIATIQGHILDRGELMGTYERK